MTGVLALSASLAAAGCHTYVPVTSAEPGSTVRVRVPVTSALDNGNAAPQTAAIEGAVIEFADTLVLAVTNRQEYGAYREVVLYDTLRLAPDQRLSVEQAEFSTGRTVLLSAAIAVGAGALALAAFNSGGGDDTPIDGGGPPPQGGIVISNSLVSGLLGALGIAR
jgi:hypothetical protein